jgi:chromosome partitioning protein
VLLIDLDPQGDLSRWCGVPADASTLADVIEGRRSMGEVVSPLDESIDIVPSADNLAAAEDNLRRDWTGNLYVRRQLATMRDRWDFMIIDTAPSLGLLTAAGILAADSVLMAMEPSPLALQGLGDMLHRVDQAKELQEALDVLGVVFVRFDRRRTLDRQAVEMVEGLDQMQGKIVATVSSTVRMTEAPGSGQSIFEVAPDSPAAQDYQKLAKEVMRRTQR